MSPAAPRAFAPCRSGHQTEGCGGARILDLALCMILAVLIVGLLMMAL